MDTWGYRGLQGVKKGLQWVTRGYRDYRGLQGVTGGYKELQGVQRITENFFLARTSLDTLSWSILHKNQS